MASQGIRASFLASSIALATMVFASDCSAQTRPKADSNSASTIKSFLTQFEGWWGFLPDGCKDSEDNQYRVALGRFMRLNGDIVFGRGIPGVGMYELGCDFIGQPTKIEDLYIIKTKCDGEGKRYRGNTTLRLVGESRLFLRTPDREGEIELYRCEK